jgi:hypothetical protein
MHAAVAAELPADALPPLTALCLGLLPVLKGLGILHFLAVLEAVPLQIADAAHSLVLQDILKQTVNNHFAYKVKHSSMN